VVLAGRNMLSSSDASFLSFSTCIFLDWDSPLSSMSTSGETPTTGGFIANVAPGISGSQDATEDHGPHDTSVAAALCDGTPVQEAMPETN
jgi:hypothetical protein